jgi:8-oxo-dGTP pyrophosphatase MutT (NUDIX family)
VNAAQAARLREVLLDPVEASRIDVSGTATAAVLVALDERAGELYAVFTRRRSDLRHHAGQISFPGGRRDAADADLAATALREAAEEIGLRAEAVTLLGALEPIPVPVSGFALYPFVGDMVRPSAWMPARDEVEEILELSLSELAGSYAMQTLRRGEREIETATFTSGEHVIWGATARILSDLLTRLGVLA